MGAEILIVATGLIIIVAVYVVSIFSRLTQLKNDINKTRVNIDALLKHLSDELPTLVASAKNMKHESSTLTKLTAARAALLHAKTPVEKAVADRTISTSLKTIFAAAENYPKLRANENFLQLQDRISGLESELTDRREFYNDSVNNYNICIESPLGRLAARMMHYTGEEPLFQVTEKERKDANI